MFFATLISRIFDPPVVITVLTIIAAFLGNVSHQPTRGIVLLLPIMLGGPLSYFLWKYKTHQVSDWDISKRQERIHPLFILLGFLFADILVLSALGNTFLLNIFLLYFLWVLGFLLITIFWKISGHTGITTLAFLLVFRWFGGVMWPFLIVIFLVSWARILRHDHTIAQVTAGIIYSVCIFSFWTVVIG